MKNITTEFEQIFIPKKALVVYQTLAETEETYVEAYDMDKKGFPINAHPLSVQESIALAKSLTSSKELRHNFLQPKGIIPNTLLFTDMGINGYAIWYSPEQKVNLFFKEELGIPCGEAHIPPLVWKADKDYLRLFAFKGKQKPHSETELYNALSLMFILTTAFVWELLI